MSVLCYIIYVATVEYNTSNLLSKWGQRHYSWALSSYLAIQAHVQLLNSDELRKFGHLYLLLHSIIQHTCMLYIDLMRRIAAMPAIFIFHITYIA